MRRRIFLAIVFAIVVIPIASAVTIKVKAPENVTANETFSVNIIVDNITNLNTALFDLSFNSSILKVEKVEDGQIGGKIVPVNEWDFISNDTIRVLIMLPGDEVVSGPGYLAKIIFKAISTGTSILDLKNGYLEQIVESSRGKESEVEIKADCVDATVNVTPITTTVTTTTTMPPTTTTTTQTITEESEESSTTESTTTVFTPTTTVVTTSETPVATTTTVVTTTTTTIPTTTATTTTPVTTTTTIPTTPITTSPVTTTTTSVKITTTTATITTTKTTVTTITQTTTTAQPVSKKEIPCFEAVFALSSILILVVLLRRRM